MTRLPVFVGAAVVLAATNRVSAIDTGFLPGDACFGSQLSQDTLAQLDSDDPVVFPYRAGKGEPALCGFAGYWNLAVDDMSGEMTAGLKRLYRELRKSNPVLLEVAQDDEGKERRLETNSFLLLIYNKDYDLRNGIGLKLNEEWMKLVSSLDQKTLQGAYWPYVTDYRAVARDWERSSLVPGLSINETDARPWWGPMIKEPVSVQADRIQILVLPERVYTSFALGVSHSREVPWDELPLEWEGFDVIEPCFYRVTNEGVSRCQYGAHGFVEEAWPLSPTREQATQIERVVESLDRASTDSFGIDDERILPDDVRERLDRLRDEIESLTEELSKVARTLKQESLDKGE